MRTEKAVGICRKIDRMVKKTEVPLEASNRRLRLNPFQVLVSLILSTRTKDTTTVEVTARLFRIIKRPGDLLKFREPQIARMILPVGFYRTKAKYLKRVSEILTRKGRIPDTLEELLELPGVGRKVANLFLGHVHNRQVIGVDIHVFRISNRVFFHRGPSRNPDQTEAMLMALFPRHLWNRLNSCLVKFGQNICFPRNPDCGVCTISADCGYYKERLRGQRV